jgi:hypothetical protein
MALDPRPAARIAAIEIRTAPEAWARSVDPGFRDAGWSTWIELSEGPPILAACYYSSESMVTCEMEEKALASPSALLAHHGPAQFG